jgi:hypothetical protein
MQTKILTQVHASLETGGNKFGQLDSPDTYTYPRFTAQALRMEMFPSQLLKRTCNEDQALRGDGVGSDAGICQIGTVPFRILVIWDGQNSWNRDFYK